MKALILGGWGQLGMAIFDRFEAQGHRAVRIGRETLDFSKVDQVEKMMVDFADVVINCVAMHDVAACEKDPSAAFHMNSMIPWVIAKKCSAAGVHFIHISTDYVFSGSIGKGDIYTEWSPKSPLNAYGASKSIGEEKVLEVHPKAAIVRVASLFGLHAKTKGGNFIDRLLDGAFTRYSTSEITMVNDQVMCPTYTRDAAEMIEMVASDGLSGFYHGVPEGHASWAELAEYALLCANKQTRVNRVPTTHPSHLPLLLRPKNAFLVNTRLPEGRNWRKGVEDYVEERRALLAAKNYTGTYGMEGFYKSA